MSKGDAYLAMQTGTRDEFLQIIGAQVKDVGNARFNQEHLHLLDIFRRFYVILDVLLTKLPTEDDWCKVDEILSELARYADTHLTAEEVALSAIGYPDLVPHKEAHDQYREMVREYMDIVSTRKSRRIFELKYKLFDWIFGHINTTDVQYAPYFIGTGAKGRAEFLLPPRAGEGKDESGARRRDI
jgi:hemerythrin-like metal-binding protein